MEINSKVLFFVIFSYFASTFLISDLTLEKWSLTNQNGSINLFNLTVPNYVHEHLHRNDLIEDPLYRYSDIEQRWISKDIWRYSTIFGVSKVGKKSVIVFKGIDTVSEIFLNNAKIAETENMFVEYIFDVTKYVKVGENKLSIQFTSAIEYAKRMKNEYPYFVPFSDNITSQHGEQYRNYIRKQQCSFSWDWAPCFPSSGIWQSAFVEGYDEYRLISLGVQTISKVSQSKYFIEISIEFDSLLEIVKIPLKVVCEELQISKVLTVEDIKIGKNDQKFILDVVNNVELWWPNNYGEQKLYEINFQIFDEKIHKRIGFREIVVIQEEFKKGRTFFFQVNGVPIFAKGANFVPLDIFNRVDYRNISRAIQAAVDTNMNVLRVWGGGIYQSDEFYEICDEKGIMVWTEMMFACAMYRSDRKFLSSVTEEVKYNVGRIKSHPSLAIIGGNNENEASLWNNTWYNEMNQTNKAIYYVDYSKLYYETIGKILKEEVPTVFYWPSSPGNGNYFYEGEFINGMWTNPYSLDFGDVHYYGAGRLSNTTNFPHSRFISEYGFESFPSFHTLKSISEKEDWSIFSKLFNTRLHSYHGVEGILGQVVDYFELSNLPDQVERFKANIYILQLTHYFFMKSQTEYYRTLMESEKTMGALYWMFNSIWQSCDESSLEYGGRWKLHHYKFKNIFSPILITSHEAGNKIVISIVDDLYPSIKEKIKVKIQMFSWSTEEILEENEQFFDTNYLSVKTLFDEEMGEFLKKFNCLSRSDCFLFMQSSIGNMTYSENFHFFSPFFEMKVKRPEILMKKFEKVSKNRIQITLESNVIAPFVFVETEVSGVFDDNGFFIFPRKEKVFSFECWEGCDLTEFQSTFTAISVKQTTA